jgi:hypothetical protein
MEIEPGIAVKEKSAFDWAAGPSVAIATTDASRRPTERDISDFPPFASFYVAIPRSMSYCATISASY